MNPGNYQRGYYNFQPYNIPADVVSEKAKIGSKAGNFLLDDWLKKSEREKQELAKTLRKLKKILSEMTLEDLMQ